jgi:hypothetical protein
MALDRRASGQPERTGGDRLPASHDDRFARRQYLAHSHAAPNVRSEHEGSGGGFPIHLAAHPSEKRTELELAVGPQAPSRCLLGAGRSVAQDLAGRRDPRGAEPTGMHPTCPRVAPGWPGERCAGACRTGGTGQFLDLPVAYPWHRLRTGRSLHRLWSPPAPHHRQGCLVGRVRARRFRPATGGPLWFGVRSRAWRPHIPGTAERACGFDYTHARTRRPSPLSLAATPIRWRSSAR